MKWWLPPARSTLPGKRRRGDTHPGGYKVGSAGEVTLGRLIELAGLPTPTPQFRFAVEELERQWRFDFAWPEERVACEFDGAARIVRWQRNPRTGHQQPVAVGRHGTAADYEKLNAAAQLGWLVLRYNEEMLRKHNALASLKAALSRRRDRRPPAVGPAGSAPPPSDP